MFTDSFFLQLINFSFRIPIFLGRQLGNTVAQYRWFLGVYIILMYFIFPLSFIAMSMIEPKGILTAVVTSLMVFMFACYMLVSFMRSRGSLRRMLPSFLLNWDFVPIWMRSLAPYDEYVLPFFSNTNFESLLFWLLFRVNSQLTNQRSSFCFESLY